MSILLMIGRHPSIGLFQHRCLFVKTDGGRSLSKRKKQKNDCTVRALALATNISYDEAYEICAEAGRKCGQGLLMKQFLPTVIVNGYRFKWYPLQAVKGEMRVTPVTFAINHPAGKYILKTAKHVLACIDGVVMDDDDGGTSPLAYRCVYGYWQLEEV